jgi:hypothetical protein
MWEANIITYNLLETDPRIINFGDKFQAAQQKRHDAYVRIKSYLEGFHKRVEKQSYLSEWVDMGSFIFDVENRIPLTHTGKNSFIRLMQLESDIYTQELARCDEKVGLTYFGKRRFAQARARVRDPQRRAIFAAAPATVQALNTQLENIIEDLPAGIVRATTLKADLKTPPAKP